MNCPPPTTQSTEQPRVSTKVRNLTQPQVAAVRRNLRAGQTLGYGASWLLLAGDPQSLHDQLKHLLTKVLWHGSHDYTLVSRVDNKLSVACGWLGSVDPDTVSSEVTPVTRHVQIIVQQGGPK